MKNFSTIFIISPKDHSADILKNFLEDFGYKDIQHFDSFSKSLEEIANREDNPIVIIDFDTEDIFFDKAIQTVRAYTSNIIAISINSSIDLIVRALRAGAVDFLQKPILKTNLKNCLLTISNNNPDNNLELDTSKIITVYSNKGGIGKTTLATNLALEIAKTTRNKVALVDLNLQLGDVSTFLNLNPSFDIAYIIKNLINKKEEVLLNAFEKCKDTDLYILSNPMNNEQAENITPLQIDLLFNTLKKIFPYIIVDLPSNIDANTLKVLDKSDYILFTSIVNIPAIRNAQRCLNLFKSRNYSSDKVKLIINRYIENDDIKIQDIETTLNNEVYWKIPNNYFTIMESINKGLFVSDVNSSSNIANSFKDLALKISDDIVRETILQYRTRNQQGD